MQNPIRIVPFGTGSALSDLLGVLPQNVSVAGLCDNDPRKQGTDVLGYRVYSPDALGELRFDFVVVTARSGEVIRKQLVARGLDRDRILLFYPGFDPDLRNAVNRDVDALNRHLGIGLHRLSLCTMQLWPRPLSETTASEDDFCRTMSLQLAAERILQKKVPGAIAELGVYRGELAALLNRLFGDRTLYLFDTFEGFSEKDLSREQQEKLSLAAAGDFQDTNVELVMARMIHPENVIVRKGYFPATVDGLEETFAFVSLDVDLHKPIAAGLEYFYPRLSKGGCVFVHDYSNRRYNGVRAAVEEFSEATGAPVVLLPDFAGTAVLPK